MRKCPNCGQPTARTSDWACQRCGYPLLSGSYKKISKTYKQLQEEKLHKQGLPVTEETEMTVPPNHGTLTPTPTLKPEPVLETKPEPVLEAKPEPVLEAKPEPVLEAKPEPVLEAKPEPVPEAKPEPVLEAKPEPVPEAKPEPVLEAKPEPVLEVKPEPVLEAKPEPVLEAKPEPVLEAKPEPAPSAMEVTVDELLSAYQADGVAAEARFASKILKITGTVGRIEVKDILDICYITLTSADKDLLQNIRCVFDQEHGAELNQLTTGQTVTVLGKYDGSIIDIRMSNCVLAR